MSSVIKGNRPLRIFSGMVLVVLVIAHFMEQIDLTQISFLWLIIVMGINAFQASFTGFCPMFKNANGECVACGVACDQPADKNASKASNSGCCSSEAASCCDDSGCCPDEKADKSKATQSCCDDEKTGCCDQTEKTPCSSNEQSADVGTDTTEKVVIKVLGSGCKNCDTTAKLIEQTAAQNKLAIQLVKVEEVAEIAAYGVMSTPAVVIDEVVVHSGSIPTKHEVKRWLQTASEKD